MPRFYHVDRRATLTEGAFIDRVKHNDVQPDVLQRRFRGEMGAAGAAIWEVEAESLFRADMNYLRPVQALSRVAEL